MWYKKKIKFYVGERTSDKYISYRLSILSDCKIISLHGRNYMQITLQPNNRKRSLFTLGDYDCIIKNNKIYLVLYRGISGFELSSNLVTIKSCGIRRKVTE